MLQDISKVRRESGGCCCLLLSAACFVLCVFEKSFSLFSHSITISGTSDPYCVVTLLANGPNEQPKVLGKTEVYVLSCLLLRVTTLLFDRDRHLLICPIEFIIVLTKHFQLSPRLKFISLYIPRMHRIKNTLNPKWTTYFDLDYHMGRIERINVGVYDEIRKGQHKPMGSAVSFVSRVMSGIV